MSGAASMSEEELEQIATEWLFYDTRFGVVTEVVNGRWTRDQLVGMAAAALKLLAEVRRRRAESP
jgi:hypothetical protein